MAEYKNDGLAVYCKIPKEDAKEAAKAWGEGYKPLEEFLEYCLSNDFQTLACCSGHDLGEKKEIPYVFFNITDNIGENFLSQMLREKVDKLMVSFVGTYGATGIGLYCGNFDDRENFFETMKNVLTKSINEKEKESDNNFIKRMVKLTKMSNFSKYYQIQYIPGSNEIVINCYHDDGIKRYSVQEMEEHLDEMEDILSREPQESNIDKVKRECKENTSDLSRIRRVPQIIKEFMLGKEIPEYIKNPKNDNMTPEI